MSADDVADGGSGSAASSRGPAPWQALAVFAAAAALLWIGAGPRDLTRNDEFRYVTVAREFLDGGWFHCRLNGETYAHKPPGYFWAVAGTHLLGFAPDTAGKLVSVLASAGTTALLCSLAWRFWGRVAGWAAAIALVTTQEFFGVSVRAQLDPLLTFWTTLSAYAFARAVLLPADDRGRTRWTAVAYLAAGIGVLVKGPPAIAVPGVAALVTLVRTDRWSETPVWRWIAGTLVLLVPTTSYGLPLPGPAGLALRVAAFAAITGVWRSDWSALRTWRWALAPLVLLPGLLWAPLAAREAPEGWGYVIQLAIGHGVAHAAGRVDKLEPWWYYAKEVPVSLLPWTFLAGAALVVARREAASAAGAAGRRALGFAVAWFVGSLVVFSLSPAKRDLYLLPIYPASALSVGWLAAAAARDPELVASRPVRRACRATGAVTVAAGLVLLVLGGLRLAGRDGWIGEFWAPWKAVAVRVPGNVPVASALLGGVFVVVGLLLVRAKSFRAATTSMAVAAVAFVAASGLVYVPLTEATSAPRPFLERVRGRIGDAYLGDYLGPERAANLYLDRTVVPLIDSRISAERVLVRTPGRVYFLTERAHLARAGMPAGAEILVEDDNPGPEGLLLLGRE